MGEGEAEELVVGNFVDRLGQRKNDVEGGAFGQASDFVAERIGKSDLAITALL